MLFSQAIADSNLEVLEDEFYYWYNQARENVSLWKGIENHSFIKELENSAIKYVNNIGDNDLFSLLSTAPLLHSIFSLFPIYNEKLSNTFISHGFRASTLNSVLTDRRVDTLANIFESPDNYLTKELLFTHHIPSGGVTPTNLVERLENTYDEVKDILLTVGSEYNWKIYFEFTYEHLEGTDTVFTDELENASVPYASAVLVGSNDLENYKISSAESIILEGITFFHQDYRFHENSFKATNTNLDRLVNTAKEAFKANEALSKATPEELLMLEPFLYQLVCNEKVEDFDENSLLDKIMVHIDESLAVPLSDIGVYTFDMREPIWLNHIADHTLPEISNDKKLLNFIGYFNNEQVDGIFERIEAILPAYSGAWEICIQDDYGSDTKSYTREFNLNEDSLSLEHNFNFESNEHNATQKLSNILDTMISSEESFILPIEALKLTKNLLLELRALEYKHECMNDTVSDADGRTYDLPCSDPSHKIMAELSQKVLQDLSQKVFLEF